MKICSRNILNLFVLFAFISAGISPACAFISGGTGFIEICAADGSSQRIEVSAEIADILNQTSKDSSDTSQDQPHPAEAFADCDFCFATSNLPNATITDSNYVPTISNAYQGISAGSIAYMSYAHSVFQARGPPIIQS